MTSRHTLALLTLLSTGCDLIDRDDAGMDAETGDAALPDMGQRCDPRERLAVSIDDNRDAIDPDALEGYDGPDALCVDSTLIGQPDCPGEVIDVPGQATGVCVPSANPDLYYRLQGCSDTVFFIERPRWLGGAIPGPPACGGQLDACLRVFLPLIARQTAYAWFCEPEDAACRTELGSGPPLMAVVESVLPVDDVPGMALPDAAYRVWFEQGGVRVPVRDAVACDLIKTLRDLIPEDQALIGRECDGPVQKATAIISADDPQAIWHKERLGLPGADVPGVPVAVIDAGVPQLAFVRSAAELSFSGTDPMAPLHSHGLGMALAITDVAPNAEILSMRVMNSSGRGNTADVARGIDRTSRENANVRIFNLSIGLAPEARLARVVTGSSCETVDDGVGESIALALEAARSRQPELLAFGSTGNRPISPTAVRVALMNSGRELVEPGDSLRYDDPCRGAPILGWFFPSTLDRCSDDAPIVGVGGISDRDQPIVIGVPGGEPALVAPAQHVLLDRERAGAMGVDRPIEDPICTPVGDGKPTLQLPMVLSGTSLAAAFASGAAAWALGRDGSLTAHEVISLLYVTGRPLCRDSADGVPVRALSVGRLDTAMSHPEFGALRACVAGAARPSVALIDGCRAALDTIGLNEMCEPQVPIGWPDAYTPAACPGLESAGPADAAPLPVCDLPCRQEVSEQAIGPELAGEAGPQPGSDFCPECAVRVIIDGSDVAQSLTLEIELWDGFEKETAFSEPWFIVKDTLTSDTYTIDLDDYTTASDWTSGALVKITGIPTSKFPGGGDPLLWTSTLVPSVQANLTGSGGVPVVQTSALRVELEDD